ncbi:MAG: flagellar assembly protein FliW [Wenzhouxiangella sp.]|jgi:flagellar assembly factor FliW|nr:flagellar assembly protein FliW [Wenzhouxiangella sp.]
MQINTTLFGPQDIQDADLITFPQGLPGLEDAVRFKVFHEEGKPTVHWFQSVDDDSICLSVMEPELLGIGYEFSLSDEQSEMIDVQENDDLVVAVVLSKQTPATGTQEVTETIGGIRANLNSPLVINTRSRKGVQVPLYKIQRLTIIKSLD